MTNIHTAPTLNSLEAVNLETLRVPMNELSVIYLNAGNDTNGNPRRCYVLSHPLHGFLACVDEGYEGWAALGAFTALLSTADKVSGIFASVLVQALRDRITPCIECSPSYRRRLLSEAVQSKMASRSVVIEVG